MSYAELLGDRTAENWSSEQAVRRALSEVLQAVVDLRQLEDRNMSLDAFLNRFRQQKVLLLGDFNKGRDRLLALRQELERLGYLGVLAEEIPDVRELDLRQKIQLLTLACRFVIVEDSTPAGQLTEAALVETTRQVTVVLRRSGMASSWMTAGLSNTSAVIKESEYDEESLSDVVGDAVAWAEQRLHELGRKLDELYPWRRDESEAREQPGVQS